MQKFEYKGKTYIKIKQDWYSEIGQKLPLKLAVELDAEFHAEIVKNEENIVALMDQARRYSDIGNHAKAYDAIVEALSLADQRNDVAYMPSIIQRYVAISRALNKVQLAIDYILQLRLKHPDLLESPTIETNLAQCYLDTNQPQLAIVSATHANEYFKKAKKKMSDDLMIIWTIIKKQYSQEYKAYRQENS